MSILYIVSTPIGNLEDITYRAVRVLREANRVLAEDTRRTAVLLQRYEIRARLVSAHEHNEAARADQVVAWLEAGETLALVSDAGTPLLSDPGSRLVNAVLAAGHQVVAIPGASALLAALVISGLPMEPFEFVGFPPRSRTERDALLDRLRGLEHTAVLYEAPSRVGPLLEQLRERCGDDRPVAVARELTKLHEEVFRGTLEDAAAAYAEGARGEFVIVLGPAAPREPDAGDAVALAQQLIADGSSASHAAREVARRLRIPRNEAYALVHSIVSETPPED